MKRYYIAYGSNLNVPQMRYRCPKATILGIATLKGWELLFKGSQTARLTHEREPQPQPKKQRHRSSGGVFSPC